MIPPWELGFGLWDTILQAINTTYRMLYLHIILYKLKRSSVNQYTIFDFCIVIFKAIHAVISAVFLEILKTAS